MNWKIAVDTFLEPYHSRSCRPRDTVGPIFFPNLCVVDGFGRTFGRSFRAGASSRCTRGRRRGALGSGDALGDRHLLFPNIAVVVQIDHYEIWRIYPVEGKPDECKVYLRFYIPSRRPPTAPRSTGSGT